MSERVRERKNKERERENQREREKYSQTLKEGGENRNEKKYKKRKNG